MNISLSIGLRDQKPWIFVQQSGGISMITRDVLANAVNGIDGAQLVTMTLSNSKLQAFWILPLSSHDSFCAKKHHSSIKNIEPVPALLLANILKQQTTVRDELANEKLRSLESYQKLYSYQKRGVEFIVHNKGRGLIGDEMGLGKTFQAAVLMQYYGVSSLVICPASLKANWKNEYKEVCGGDLHVLQNGKSVFERTSVISYGLLTSKSISNRIPQFEMLVIDESHYIKTQTSKRTKIITKLAKKAKFVILLSGTPSSRAHELFSQLRVVAPSFFKNFFPFQGRVAKDDKRFFFASRYCDPQKVFIGRGKYGFTFNGITRPWELHAMLQYYMIRRMKEVVLKDLPEKMRQKVILENLSTKKTVYFKEQLLEIEDSRATNGSRQAECRLMELVRETAKMKEKFIVAYIKHLLSEDSTNKYLLFAHHHAVLDAICAVLTGLDKKFISIDGRTKATDRQSLVDTFQVDPAVSCAVLGITSAGTGLNLFAANIVVFTELLWNAKSMLQAEDRSHRIGQQRPVTIKYLILGGSTDDLVWLSLNSKIKATSAVLDNKRQYLQAERLIVPKKQKIQ